jgi:hypothetical protein
MYITWGLIRPQGDESCRWQAVDGRWVAVTVGTGAELGTAIVTDSSGHRVITESFEEALATAKRWRT